MFRTLAPLFVTAFVDVVGLLLVLPLFPYYARHLGASALMVTLLMVAFTAAQVVSAPLWGRVSDRYGRRPVLLVGVSVAACAYLVFAYATSLWLLLLSRVVQGAGGATTGVVQAYVADAVPPQARAKVLGWLSAATNLGMALGAPLGGLALRQGGRAGPGVLAAALCGGNLLFAQRYLVESPGRSHVRSAPRPGTTRAVVRRIMRAPGARVPRLLWMYGLAMGAFQAVFAILALFLADRFGVGANGIWVVFTYLGVVAVAMRVRLLGWAVARYGEVRLYRIGLGALAIGVWLLPHMPTVGTLAAATALIPVGTALTFPCLTASVSQAIPAKVRGLYLGVQQTCGGMGSIVVPLWAGYAYDRWGAGVPFWTVALLVLGALSLGLRMPSDDVDRVRDERSAPHAVGETVP